MSPRARKPFTGRHMFVITATFFGVVIAVNFTMASYASSTFGGVVVQNSYVASQHFNRWLDQAEAQRELGWLAATSRVPGGKVEVAVTGPVEVTRLTGLARQPLGRTPDQTLIFEPVGNGKFVSTQTLGPERWTLRLQIEADGRLWRHEEPLP